MNILLDTHTIIWMLTAPEKLSKIAIHAITESPNVYWNSLSLWEISIKLGQGKRSLKVPQNWSQIVPNELTKNNVYSLPTKPSHYLKNSTLPWHHRDPFDRLLISIAIEEELTIITRDSKFSDYPVKTLW